MYSAYSACDTVDGKQGGDLKALVEEMDVDADAPAQPAGAAELAAAATERLNYINGGGDSAMKTDGDRSVDAPLDKACILHMDSLGMHSAQNIAKWLRRYALFVVCVTCNIYFFSFNLDLILRSIAQIKPKLSG